MRRKLAQFFHAPEWTGFIITGGVIIFINAFMKMITQQEIYIALSIMVFVDLIFRSIRLWRHKPQHVIPYEERCAQALRNQWVRIKEAERLAGCRVTEDQLIPWDDWNDERNKDIHRSLALATIKEYFRWRSEYL